MTNIEPIPDALRVCSAQLCQQAGQEARQETILQALWDNWALCRGRGMDWEAYLNLVRGLPQVFLGAKGERYHPRVTSRALRDGTVVWCIEPDAGCTTHILLRPGAALFIDAGCACYERELMTLAHTLVPDLDQRRTDQLITHADIDHVGVFSPFRYSYCSGICYDNFLAENRGQPCLREVPDQCRPACILFKCLTGYQPPAMDRLRILGDPKANPQEGLECTGEFLWEGLRFQVFQGAGGHVPGELVLLETTAHLLLAGDLHISGHRLTPGQTAFNRVTLELLGTADLRPELAARERKVIHAPPAPGVWDVCCGHGGMAQWEL